MRQQHNREATSKAIQSLRHDEIKGTCKLLLVASPFCSLKFSSARKSWDTYFVYVMPKSALFPSGTFFSSDLVEHRLVPYVFVVSVQCSRRFAVHFVQTLIEIAITPGKFRGKAGLRDCWFIFAFRSHLSLCVAVTQSTSTVKSRLRPHKHQYKSV